MTSGARTPAPLRSRPYRRDRPERARSQPEAHTARAPPLVARMVARAPTGVPDRDSVTRQALRARSRPERARSHQKPGTRQNQPEARTARAPPLVARMVARAPTGVPDRDSVTRQALRARSRPERARSHQKPGTRQNQPEARTARAPSAGACRGARTDRRTSPRRRYAPALRARRRPERARSQPQAPTARYFASARSPIRSGFDCDARALRNCNSTRPSCARRRRRSASVIGCGRPAWSHRMHSSFVRVGFSFLLHVHAGRYGCSASGFHSLTSSRSRNRSSSVRE